MKAQLAHQTSDTPTPNLDALVDEFALNARTPVRSTTDLERIDDLRSQAFVFQLAIRGLSSKPSVEAALGYTKDAT
jgi:hypothetical protein